MSERWAPVPGWEGWYLVSDAGRVMRRGRSGGVDGGRLLKIIRNSLGYATVHLRDAPRQKVVAVHRLVMLAFGGPAPAGWHVHHRDANRMNSRLDNLEWLAPAEHMATRRLPRGSESPASKLTEQQVAEIRALRGTVPQRELARRYGVTQAAVKQVQLGRHWQHTLEGEAPQPKPLWPKLSEDQVREIRTLVGTGLSQSAVARRFGVNSGTVSRIVRREIRGHVG